jgi:hypothetical protein
VRVTAPLERQVKMHSAQPADDEAYVHFMGDTALDWTPEERKRLEAVTERLEPVISRLIWQPSKPILLAKSTSQLEDGLPHTRANVIVLPDGSARAPLPYLAVILAHEVFHVMSRDDPALRERLYEAIGFKPCASVSVPPAIEKLRLSNPDAPLHRHSIAVRYRGRNIDAMPYPLLPANVDPPLGFREQVRPVWLLVERRGDACRATEEAAPKEMDGLFEQIGRNTQYLWHPEEILADNFAILVLGELSAKPLSPPSPEVLERLRPILFRQ